MTSYIHSADFIRRPGGGNGSEHRLTIAITDATTPAPTSPLVALDDLRQTVHDHIGDGWSLVKLTIEAR